MPFSLNELKHNRQTSVIHHKLAGFADVGLEVIGAAPCDEALDESSVLPCRKDSVFLTGNDSPGSCQHLTRKINVTLLIEFLQRVFCNSVPTWVETVA